MYALLLMLLSLLHLILPILLLPALLLLQLHIKAYANTSAAASTTNSTFSVHSDFVQLRPVLRKDYILNNDFSVTQ